MEDNHQQSMEEAAAAAAAESEAVEEQAAESPEALLAAAEEALAAQTDKYLRLSAEFDNYRKRTIREKAELIRSAGEKVIMTILPVLDDMERAIATLAESDDPASLEGVQLIHAKFIKLLEGEGLRPIEAEGKPFDTDFHEAIALVPSPTEEQKGKILDCIQTGYTLNDKVIRHAKVAVGQ